ncbi:hypothetical protein [Natronococcus wangiae]|uniref:hypothetical protein n=1 Tax=Natronococcus wangiae TaxID=3068275 RepID=UPI00273E7689|nr:hypothetical protein [Natronococcus sp. AD5]
MGALVGAIRYHAATVPTGPTVLTGSSRERSSSVDDERMGDANRPPRAVVAALASAALLVRYGLSSRNRPALADDLDERLAETLSPRMESHLERAPTVVHRSVAHRVMSGRGS